MHWVVQKNIFKTGNYQLLIDALDSLGIDYTPVNIRPGKLELEPEVFPSGKVYVCGWSI